jgi:hypothetical protein
MDDTSSSPANRLTIMKTPLTTLLSLLSASVLFAMPQDYWSNRGADILATSGESYKGIAVGTDGLAYIGIETTTGQVIGVLDTTGAELRRFGTFTDIRGIAVNSLNEIHVFDLAATNKISVFDTNGILLRGWGSTGTAGGEFTEVFTNAYGTGGRHSLLGISGNDDVYVIDADAYRIQIFNKDGLFIREFGSQGDLVGQFNDSPSALAVFDDGHVCVFADWKRSGNIVHRLTVFDSTGAVIDSVSRGGIKNLCLSPDGLIIVTRNNQPVVDIYTRDLELLGAHELSSEEGSWPNSGISMQRSGEIWAAYGATNSSIKLLIRRRQYTEADLPLTPTDIPQPEVTKVAQRTGTTLVDVDYRVIDTDSATVETAMVVYTGTPSLANLLLPTALLEGTDANLGATIATNTLHRVTWDAAADWNVDTGSIQVEILAKDDRGLHPIRWVTYPGEGGDPDLTISAEPLLSSELYALWVWFIAKRDPALSLVAGQVVGVGGAYDSQILYDGANTTAEGRSFLLARLNVATHAGDIVKKLP